MKNTIKNISKNIHSFSGSTFPAIALQQTRQPLRCRNAPLAKAISSFFHLVSTKNLFAGIRKRVFRGALKNLYRIPLKAILFDMDGVIVDSEKSLYQAAMMMFKEHNVIVHEDDFLPFIGTGEKACLEGIAAKYSFNINIERDKKRTYDIYIELIKGKLKCLPGAVDFIEECRNRNLKIAIATSADSVKMKANLKATGLPPETFDALIDGLQVERKKPFPDIYLLAASALHVKPEECLVVEDAIKGIEAAKAAGAKCLALTTSFSAEHLKKADWIIPDLSYIDEVIDKIF